MATNPPHPTATALVAAVCATPTDSLPRLVYADWLDEQADPHSRLLADYIRIETELAGMPQDDLRGSDLIGRLIDLCAQSHSPLGGWEYATGLDRIRQKMDQLRTADSTMALFGVGGQGGFGHGYQVQPPISEPALLKFELELAHHLYPPPRGELFPSEAPFGWLLPPEYRAFLLQVGNGPMGPYYGLTPFNLGRDPKPLRRPFPIGRAAADQAEIARRSGVDESALYFEDGQENDGNLHLSEIGCGGQCLLSVCGDTFGNVWVSWDTGVSLTLREDGTPHTFLTWYEHWLDTSLKPEALERWRSLAARRGPTLS